MFVFKATHYICIGHGALFGRLHPKFKLGSLSAATTLTNHQCFKGQCRHSCNSFEQLQLRSSIGLAGYSTVRHYVRKNLFEEAASDQTLSSIEQGVQKCLKFLETHSKLDMQILQLKLTEALQTDNVLEASRRAQEIMTFIEEKTSNIPVEPLRQAGIFCLTNLTWSDLTYILPLITITTRYLIDRERSPNNAIKSLSLDLPIIIFSLMMHTPAAIPAFHACKNVIHLGYLKALKTPAVREYFKIDELITDKTKAWPSRKGEFDFGVKKPWLKLKKMMGLKESVYSHQILLDKGQLVITFKYDPTRLNKPFTISVEELKK